MIRRALLGLLAGAVLTAPALAQTIDEVIAKSFEARGGLAKLKAIQTLRMTGKMTMGSGIELPLTIEMKRPSGFRAEFVFQGSPAVQAYDGTTAWGISPMGSNQPEPMPAEMAKELADQADMDGPLVDYKAKGHQVELLGKEKVEGSDAFKLKVTKKDGDVEYYYLEAESYLPVKVEAKRTIRGSEIEGETTLGDYKEAGGFLWPYSIQNSAKGRPEKQNLTIETIEINPAIDDARFKMPAPKPAEAPKQD
jgi:outer membrane lipoprotein-sorting protein